MTVCITTNIDQIAELKGHLRLMLIHTNAGFCQTFTSYLSAFFIYVFTNCFSYRKKHKHQLL